MAANTQTEFLRRVQRAYRIGQTGFAEPAKASIWGQIGQRQQPLHEALISEDIGQLRRIFENPVESNLFYGVDNLCLDIAGTVASNPGAPAYFADAAQTEMAQLARAVGALKFEHSSLPAEEAPPVEDLLQRLDKVLGFTIDFPSPFRGEFGLKTSRGLASHRAIQALYQIWRVRETLRVTKAGSLIEIGPGMGRTAYYAWRSGLSDVATVDLPLGTVAQACFLGAALSPDAIWLAGDTPHEQRGRLRILPRRDLSRAGRFKVALNVDSLTEMDRDAAVELGSWLAVSVDVFLSINHEGNAFTAAEIAEQCFPSTRLVRASCAVKPGYLDEVFDLHQFARRARPRWARLLGR